MFIYVFYILVLIEICIIHLNHVNKIPTDGYVVQILQKHSWTCKHLTVDDNAVRFIEDTIASEENSRKSEIVYKLNQQKNKIVIN